MHFVNIAIGVTMAAMAQAFTMPEGTTNGVYVVHIDPNGKEVHTKIYDSTDIQSSQPDHATTVGESGDLERRYHGEIWCGCGFNMNPGNCDRAVEMLVAQMGPSFVDPNKSYYSSWGDVVAFACNRNPNESWLLVGSTYRDEIAAITGACGRYIAGAKQWGDDGKALIQGYARWAPGDNFCGGSTSSPANHC
ncbi:hypothetical protein NQ176_g6726 [Zarea fungicola]|uniref:Uncharacterized protein n=1 Tax=Zarea fungicola TaxID=93591 RepID=A0ACC1N2U3_9HYPO|nr:hypothetical protein NQ176_g6726 [Lecanicillium fungicola]